MYNLLCHMTSSLLTHLAAVRELPKLHVLFHVFLISVILVVLLGGAAPR